MARERKIKYSFFENEYLAELEPLTRLLFIGLWCLADREGRLEDRPARIKAQVLPYDSCDADKMLNELEGKGFIQRYGASDKYIQISNFAKHQKVHPKEPASQIPSVEQVTARQEQAVEKNGEKCFSEKSRENNPFPSFPSYTSFPSYPSFNTNVCPPAEPSGCDQPKKGDYSQDFEDFWQEYPRRKEKQRAWKVWKARLKEGLTPKQLIDAARNYTQECRAKGTEEQYIKHAATFLGPNRPFEEYINGVPTGGMPKMSKNTAIALELVRLAEEEERRKNEQSGDSEDFNDIDRFIPPL